MAVEPALSRGALRISLGWLTAETDMEILLTAWKTVVSSLPNRQATTIAA